MPRSAFALLMPSERLSILASEECRVVYSLWRWFQSKENRKSAQNDYEGKQERYHAPPHPATHLTEACCTSLTWDGPPLPWSSPVPREAAMVAEQERLPSVDLRSSV